MHNLKYKDFNQWFHQLEGFHLLSERFYTDCETMTPQYMTEWLKAAFESAREKHEQPN